MVRKPEKSIVIDNKKEKNIKNLPDLAVNNNHPLPN